MVSAEDRKNQLTSWAATHGRRYPWRETRDPWAVFVAEMLLRRTHADRVADIYKSVVSQFPDAETLAGAPAATLHSAVSSLGLRGRADQLRQAAQEIVRRFQSKVPVDPSQLMDLPGVGPYVAGAVAAGAGGQDAILIDTNTVRVATRYFGVELQAKDVRRQKVVVEAVTALFGGPAGPNEWWAVIDLAALVCRPREPTCEICPLRGTCEIGQRSH